MGVNNREIFANSMVWSVLSMETTKSMSNFPSFLKLLKEFHFSKGPSTISVKSGPYFHSNTDIYSFEQIH